MSKNANILAIILNFLQLLVLTNCENFPRARIEDLMHNFEDNGGDKFLLEYAEYLSLEQSGLPPQVIEAYKGKVDALEAKIAHFSRQGYNKAIVDEKLMEKMGDDEEMKNLWEMKENVKTINCKLFMIDLFSEGGEFTFLSLKSFLENGRGRIYRILREIYDISNVQNEQLDKLINLAMLSAHMRNNRAAQHGKSTMESKTKVSGSGKGGGLIEKVVVEGAGPNGLYAALELFLSGTHVALVNDRIGYTRTRRMSLHLRWIVRLRFWLGTKVQNLPWDTEDTELDQFNVKYIDLKQLEILMKERLESLVEFIREKGILEEEQHSLVLLYGTKVKGISYSEELESYVAELSPPDNFAKYSADMFKYKSEEIMQQKCAAPGEKYWRKKEIMEEAEKWLNDEKRANIIRPLLELKYGRKVDEKELNSGKWLASSEYPSLKFDLLLCAGGVTDRVRTQLLGVKNRIKFDQIYGLATFLKNRETMNERIFARADVLKGMKLDKKSLRNQKINDLIRKSKLLEDHVKDKYTNLSENLSLKPLIYIHENSQHIQIYVEMPDLLVELFKAIKSTQEHGKQQKQAEIEQFQNRILRKWFAAILNSAMKWHVPWWTEILTINIDANGDRGEFDGDKFNFDPYPGNMGMFAISIDTPKEAAKLFSNYKEGMEKGGGDENVSLKRKFDKMAINKQASQNGNTAIVAAIGDANVNVHFFAGQALSIARVSIENVARLVKHYNNKLGRIQSREDLMDLIESELKRTQKKAIELMEIRMKLKTLLKNPLI